MKPLDVIRLLAHFAQARWAPRFATRSAFEVWQAKRLARFLRRQLPRSAYYRRYAGSPLAALPIVDKSVMLTHFADLNAAGVSLAEASAAALSAESTRDFSARLRGITVGLSSGTQGPRGVFMTSDRERARWAGIMLARTLTPAMLGQLVRGRQPLKIAFFLRANSNLYTTLASRRIDFRFYDLYAGVDCHLEALQAQQPDVLVAPASVLARLAEVALAGGMRIAPQRVISVAEVLEAGHRRLIERAFGGLVHQLYQCTEGFLGYTCEQGVLHLNEEYVHIEPEWLDAARTRFVPIVTDFSRSTQQVIRYRLNDVLRVREQPCSCGRVSLALASVEGRSDDVLWLRSADPAQALPLPLFPDMVRHAISSAPLELPDYRIEQHGAELRIAVADGSENSRQALGDAIGQLALRQGLRAPHCAAMPFVQGAPHVKRRRIVCVQPEPALAPGAAHA
jgi:putative adenylate-forming enzyme